MFDEFNPAYAEGKKAMYPYGLLVQWLHGETFSAGRKNRDPVDVRGPPLIFMGQSAPVFQLWGEPGVGPQHHTAWDRSFASQTNFKPGVMEWMGKHGLVTGHFKTACRCRRCYSRTLLRYSTHVEPEEWGTQCYRTDTTAVGAPSEDAFASALNSLKGGGGD